MFVSQVYETLHFVKHLKFPVQKQSGHIQYILSFVIEPGTFIPYYQNIKSPWYIRDEYQPKNSVFGSIVVIYFMYTNRKNKTRWEVGQRHITTLLDKSGFETFPNKRCSYLPETLIDTNIFVDEIYIKLMQNGFVTNTKTLIARIYWINGE